MSEIAIEGGCTCGEIRYRVNKSPMIVHCCHCRWCQRETGSSYVLNAILESSEHTVIQGQVQIVDTPSNSGGGQRIARCPSCKVALWSYYSTAKEAVLFLRVGTLDNPDAFPPDINIFTSSKQPWVILADTIPSVPEYYKRSEVWPAASIERYMAALDMAAHGK